MRARRAESWWKGWRCPLSLVADDQAGLCGWLRDSHARFPVWAELRRDAVPAHPFFSHRRELVVRPEHVQRKGSHRRSEARERDLLDGDARGAREQQRYLLAATATLAGTHAGAREALDLILIDWPVAEHGVEVARRHLS